jgi:type III pantothenate kinase
MILLFNIGNTNLMYGLFHQKIITMERFPIAELSEQRDFTKLCYELLQRYELSPGQIKGSVLASVVPGKTPLLRKALKSLFSSEPLFVSEESEWGFDHTAYTGILGTDRMLCCQGALAKYQPPFIVVDCGTATTLNVVEKSGAFIGGVILPGILTGIQALTSKTSLLQPISISEPNSVIGKNTAECMLSGAVFGAAAQLEGLVMRIQREMNREASVIITGGNAKVIIPHLRFQSHYEPDLLLQGLVIQYKKYQKNLFRKEILH